MTSEQKLIDSGLRAWKGNVERAENFFNALSAEQLQQEIAPGRNRLIYLWGHLAAANDALFPLLGVGSKLHPELDAIFLASPDRSATSLPSATEIRRAWDEIHVALWIAFNTLSASDWLAKHTAVSDEEFVREPHRNRYTVMLSRTSHIAFHYGQAILAKPRG